MNKYKEAMNYLWNSYDDNKIYGIASRGYLEILQELVDKADSFEWIPFVLEKGEFCCPIPEVDEEILVTTGKYVWMDTFIEYGDGYALDGSHEFDEGLAWMPFPQPNKEKLEHENKC